MASQQFVPDPHYFGKYQRYIAIFAVIVCFQLPFFSVIGLTLYALATFNSSIIAIQGLAILFAYPIKRSELFISLVRKYTVPTAYFKNFYRIFDQKISDETKPLFCFHPHSVFAYCIIANMNTGDDKMTNMISLVSRFIFNVPLTGIIFRLFGVDSVDPRNVVHLMKQGKTIGILPGGFQEATLTTPAQMRIFIKKRFGFIKYALKYGYTIYPTITFNEHKQFYTFDYFLWLRLQINKLKFPAVVFFSRWLLFLNPNFQMVTVVGKGLHLEAKMKNQEPTKHQIHQIQTKYIEEVERLYTKYQHLNQNAPLRIF